MSDQSNEALQDYLYAEASNRHAAAVFLILYALIGLDTMSIEDPKLREKMTVAWIAWGITFILLGFFIIGPEQAAIAKAHRQPKKTASTRA